MGKENNTICLALLFPIFALSALGVDSVYFSNTYFDGRQLTNFLVIGYFLLMVTVSADKLRRLMLIMVFLSYIGELLFCKLLGMYQYRTPPIPLYVPFGHAIVYASGYILTYTAFAQKNAVRLRKIFAIAFCAIFITSAIFLNDIFTLISGALFFVLLKRKRWDNLYYFIAICVIFIELVGTFFRCWVWQPEIFGFLPTANPPLGAVFIYAGGDVLLAKIVSVIRKRKIKLNSN
jgi:hypothetical protein